MEMPCGFIAAMPRHANEPFVDLATPTAVENGLAVPRTSVVDSRALTRCRMLSIALCQMVALLMCHVAALCRMSAVCRRMLALCQKVDTVDVPYVGAVPKDRQHT